MDKTAAVEMFKVVIGTEAANKLKFVPLSNDTVMFSQSYWTDCIHVRNFPFNAMASMYLAELILYLFTDQLQL